ncbi:hypothetical protein VN23_12130 [Janthinobacterium sp. B9-8]|nr:hypothetical protein VN23_12130 [Janthinobacterium sp. B9-8]
MRNQGLTGDFYITRGFMLADLALQKMYCVIMHKIENSKVYSCLPELVCSNGCCSFSWGLGAGCLNSVRNVAINVAIVGPKRAFLSIKKAT